MCESVGKADLVSDNFATHLPSVSETCHLFLQVERGQASLVSLGPLWGHRPIGYV